MRHIGRRFEALWELGAGASSSSWGSQLQLASSAQLESCWSWQLSSAGAQLPGWGQCLKFEAHLFRGAQKGVLQTSLSCHPWVVKIIFVYKIVHMDSADA